MKFGMMFSILAIAATVVSAQTADELKAQIATLDQQMPTLNRAFLESPEFKDLMKNVDDTSAVYNEALSKNQEISDLDGQLVELRQRTAEIVKQRVEKELQLSSNTLAAEKAAKDAADRELRDARANSEFGKALAQRLALEAELADASSAQATE